MKILLQVDTYTSIYFSSLVDHIYSTEIKFKKWKVKIACFWGLFSSHSRIFHSYGDVNIAGEGLQILIYARFFGMPHHFGTGHPFILIISERPVTLTPIAEHLAVELSLPVVTT